MQTTVEVRVSSVNCSCINIKGVFSDDLYLPDQFIGCHPDLYVKITQNRKYAAYYKNRCLIEFNYKCWTSRMCLYNFPDDDGKYESKLVTFDLIEIDYKKQAEKVFVYVYYDNLAALSIPPEELVKLGTERQDLTSARGLLVDNIQVAVFYKFDQHDGRIIGSYTKIVTQFIKINRFMTATCNDIEDRIKLKPKCTFKFLPTKIKAE